MTDWTGHIDQYLKGELSEEEEHSFEQEMAQNPELKREFELQKKLTALLEASERVALREKVAELSKPNTSGHRVLWMSVAAVGLIAIVSTYFLVHMRYTDAALSEAYDGTYPDLVTTMGSSEQEVQHAMKYYNDGDFINASRELTRLRVEQQINGLEIYEVVALRKSSKFQSAIDLAKEMMATDTEQKAAFEWELILAYLGNNEGVKARKQLDHFLKMDYGYKTEEATTLKSDLSSFWR